ncbi:MAG: DUF3048 domain-containing protein [Patescibacteria group bacterium]
MNNTVRYFFVIAVATVLLLAVHPVDALDRAMIYAPKVNGYVLDQPMQVVGQAAMKSSVFFWVDGKFVGGIAVNKPVSKGSAVGWFTYTYRPKLKPGKHTLESQVVKGKVKSTYAKFTFTVPAVWPRKIDGAIVATPEWNQLPFGIMIENTPAARPQAGLSDASVIYETVAESGVTRFIAFFPQSVKPKSVGPIRSLRPYYVDWAKEFDALLIHAGGSLDAFRETGNLKVRAYDSLTKVGAAYTARRCYGVHCLYTDTQRLTKLVQNAKVAGLNAVGEGWKFKDPAPLKQRPNTKKKLIIQFSSTTYQVDWVYDRASNRYRRFQAGVPAKDKNTNRQLEVASVLVQLVPKERVVDRQGRLILQLIGRGKALLFRDGQYITLRWEKKSLFDRTRFYLSNGKEVEFNRGATWVEVVPGARKVLYQ